MFRVWGGGGWLGFTFQGAWKWVEYIKGTHKRGARQEYLEITHKKGPLGGEEA